MLIPWRLLGNICWGGGGTAKEIGFKSGDSRLAQQRSNERKNAKQRFLLQQCT